MFFAFSVQTIYKKHVFLQNIVTPSLKGPFCSADVFSVKNVVFYDVFVKKRTFKGPFTRKNCVFSSLWYPYGTLMVPLWYHKGTIRTKNVIFSRKRANKGPLKVLLLEKTTFFYPYGTLMVPQQLSFTLFWYHKPPYGTLMVPLWYPRCAPFLLKIIQKLTFSL